MMHRDTRNRPATRGQPARLPAPTNVAGMGSTEPSGRAGKVLVVEDDPTAARFAAYVPGQRAGFGVTHLADPVVPTKAATSLAGDVAAGMTNARRVITVLVPAQNEEADIAATIQSLQGQSREPDFITVMCDNCDDGTAEIAAGYGARVLHSHDNTGRKAGAMNQALAILLPPLADSDLVMCMDADTVVHPDLLKNAERHFAEEKHLGAVSSNHLIKRCGTPMELLQAMEYERDRRMIGRRKGRLGCMTGMAAVYRVEAMRDVIRAYGEVYDPTNWTEDWKLTIALKHLRWNMVRPQDCLATTVPVSTVKGLFVQRERWARGYIQTLCQFGLTRWTTFPWLRQLGLAWSLVARLGVLYLMYLSLHHLFAAWLLPVMFIMIADNVNTAHKAGWRAILVAIAFPIEMAYSTLITAAILSGYWKHFTGVGANDAWRRVRR
jgi:cellulose synthase/poly-beta-1,6-N-acetylglucosamine synthase-like glycosyltransferase